VIKIVRLLPSLPSKEEKKDVIKPPVDKTKKKGFVKAFTPFLYLSMDPFRRKEKPKKGRKKK